jgi:hypothetical protein
MLLVLAPPFQAPECCYGEIMNAMRGKVQLRKIELSHDGSQFRDMRTSSLSIRLSVQGNQR